LLNSIIEDLKEDEKREFKSKGDSYFFSSVVNYPNNKSLVRQNVYVDKDGNITKVEVVDKEGNAQIIMNFQKQQYDKKFDKDYFELNSLLKMNQSNDISDKKKNEDTTTDDKKNENATSDEKKNEDTTTSDTNQNVTDDSNGNEENNDTQNTNTKTTASIGDIVYPMYLPNNTYLTGQEKVNTKDGERLILTFGGDSSFILVEEVGKIEDENVVVPVSGEFDFLTDVIGIIDHHSLSWHSNGIDYYMASDVIETAELIDIARSISVLPVSK
jgi:hypothetical protein